MSEINEKEFHQMYGPAKRRIVFKKSDFVDYLLMLLLCATVLYFGFSTAPYLMLSGLFFCLVMALMFPLRHGASINMPVILKAPKDVLFMFVYKLRNMKPMFLVAIGVLAVDNLFIWLTPGLPHHSAWLREAALILFYAHFILVSLYRTAILVAHLRLRERVREVLMQTAWKGALEQQPNITLQIVHAYATGMLTHLVLLVPWYFLITHVQYSVLSLLVVSIINVVVHAFHLHTYSKWFYRDHWLAHNSEFEFIYLHGTHHDAIPCGLIGVSGNGFLEGLMRGFTGNPMPMYSPLIAFLLHTVEVIQDIRMHQYIPGVFPMLPRSFHELAQHSTHHFGRLEPYGIGLRMHKRPDPSAKQNWLGFPPIEILNSIELDEKLNGFEWDNPRYQRFMEIYDKYQKP